MLPRLLTNGIQPTVVCLFRRTEGIESELLAGGYDVRFLRSEGILSRVRELRRIVADEQPNVIHTTLFRSSVLGRVAASRSTVVLTSLVSTPYVRARLNDPDVKRSALTAVRLIDGWTARNLTTHFHAISRVVKREAIYSLGLVPDRVTVIERGRDPERLGSPSLERRRRVRRTIGIRDDEEVLVHVGRQEFPKGHRYLLEAIDLLAERRPRLVALLAGREGAATPELRQLASRPGIRRSVRFLGHRNDVPDLLAAGDIFVFPSLFEGLGGSLIEASALGLPIVASDLPAMREVVEVGRNALLVPPENPVALANSVSSLLDRPTVLRTFGERSREIFEERFTIERSSQRMIELYRSLVGSTQPAAPIAGT